MVDIERQQWRQGKKGKGEYKVKKEVANGWEAQYYVQVNLKGTMMAIKCLDLQMCLPALVYSGDQLPPKVTL